MNADQFRHAIEGIQYTGQEDLGEKLGLTRQSINRILGDKQAVTETLKRLLAALTVIEREGMQKKYQKVLDEYHYVTHNEPTNRSQGDHCGNE